MPPVDPSLIPPDMRAELDSFSRDAQAIVDSFLKRLDEPAVPERLYHYTNAAGLKGILKSGTIWLSDTTSLNDPSEMVYGFTRALPVLREHVANIHRAGQIFTNNITAFAESGLVQRVAHFFVGSFSSRPDDLAQWRAYADGAKGYALGFDGKLLEQAFIRSHDGSLNRNRSTFHIQYEDNLLREVHTEIVKRMSRLILLPEGRRDLPDGAINAYMNELMLSTLLHLLQVVLSFKHSACAHEDEFRFLETHRMDQPPDVKTRTRSGADVRYRDFDWHSRVPEALVEIRIGPGADFEAVGQFAKDLLAAVPGLNPEIIRSEIPYRAM